MAPVSDVERDGDSTLQREDVLCPICLEVFCEPVTLPCSHTFCKVCFLESVDKATLCCPLCRKRMSVWARQHSKNLVNQDLWKRIQSAFPQLRVQEEQFEPVFCPRLSEPGALRQEYEDQVFKLSEERRELDEQENKASAELIQKLLAEEEELLRVQQQQDQEDERLARMLSQELNSVSDLEQSPVSEPPVVKKKLTGMDRFLFPLSRSPAHASSSNKENFLAPSAPPPLDYYGPHTNQSQPPQLHSDESQPPQLHTKHSQSLQLCIDLSEPEESSAELQDQAKGGTKRKSQSEGEGSQGKRSCQSSPLGVALEEWEAELQKRRKQEEEDLRVAMELQRELDRQQRATDRRKGSEDAYELRQVRRNRSQTTTTTTTSATTTTTSTPRARKRPPTATVTQASVLKTDSTTSVETPAPNPAFTPGKMDKRGPKSSQTSPHSSGSKRQTTLTDLFNLHS